ncbi:MAG: hypothetical protein B1H13_03100 [Desulfobacteraceae bacterium 4484_190.3]|nr:MAG: hypothetical protein B1H13_03100 [Desulfobacteraceae bacterium 4484_190.3]
MKSMKVFLVFLGIVAILGLMIPSGAMAVKEIKIGVIYPLTGGAAAAGRELRAGAELAAKIANNAMPELPMTMARNAGIQSLGGAKVKLIFKDHQGNPTLGADLAKKLILDDKVDGILGCYLFELLKGLTEGKVRGVPAIPKKDLMNIASACEKTEWGSHVSGLIKDFAKEYGFRMRKSLLYAAKSADLSSEVRSLKAARPDVMLFASYTSDAILMVKTLKAQKAQPKIIWGQDAGFEKPEFRNTLGEGIVGILTRTVFLPKVVEIKKLAGQVNALYKAKTGNDLGGASARAFTGLQTWVHVLEKAGSTKPADIQRAANAIYIPGKELVVPWAGIKFSNTGDELGQNVLGSGLIGQYQKQKDGTVGLEIVYPFDVSSADMIYPFPKW